MGGSAIRQKFGVSGRSAAALATAMLLAAAIWAPAVGAAAPNPSAGSATVDGSPAEWDLGADFFATMANAGTAGQPVVANLYLRYDCETETLYGLVLAADGWQAQQTRPENAYLSIDGTGKLVSGEDADFAWVGGDGTLADGFEASGELAPGTYTVRAHVLIDDPSDTDDGYIPTDTVPRHAPLVIECGGEEPTDEEPTDEEPSGSELPVEGTPTPEGTVKGVTGTPRATPPSTDTELAAAAPTTGAGLPLALLGIGFAISVAIVLRPAPARSRR